MSKQLYYKNEYITDENPDAGYPRGEFIHKNKKYLVDAMRVSDTTNETGLIIKKRRIPYVIRKDIKAKYAWSYEFTLESLKTEVYLKDIVGFKDSDKFSIEDFYGINLDGENKKVEIRFIGYTNNRLYDPDGVYHPCSLETEAIANKVSPDGETDYDSDLGLISFANGSNSNRIYRIQKINVGYVVPD